MSDNDWWNDLYGDEQATADASDVTDQRVLVGSVSPGITETNTAQPGFLPPPAHTWGSGRKADPFLTQHPAHGPKGEINTPEEAAELEKRKKADKPEKAPEEAKEEEPESKPAPEVPPMPAQAPTVGVSEKGKSEGEGEGKGEEPQGVKALLKVFKDKKTKAVETSIKSVEEAAQKAAKAREETVAEAKKTREDAEKALAKAQQDADRLTEEGSNANPREAKAAKKALRDARKAHNKAAREETRVDKEAEQAEKAAVKEAQQAANEARKDQIKQAREDMKEGVINTVAPPDSGVRTVSSKVTGSSGWSYLGSLAAAWAIPVTFPVALLDRVVMVFGSPRPLSGTERMDWNLLHGPGRWFGGVIDAHVAAGDVARLVTLCAVGAVPVLFAQLGDRIARRGLRKALGWLAYGFPVFFICMRSYFDSLGFHSADDLYVTALAASSLWGFAYSRTIDPGFARVVFRIPLAAVIVGLGLTAPGAAF